MKKPHRHVSDVRAEVERTLREAGGDVERAAALAGCAVPTYYQRARRCGVSITRARVLADAGLTGAVPAPPTGEAVLTDTGVTLTLADYATLQTEAAMGREAARLEAALDTAERVIAALTRNLEAMGRRAA